MHKIFIFLSFTLFLLVGCGGSKESASNSETSNPEISLPTAYSADSLAGNSYFYLYFNNFRWAIDRIDFQNDNLFIATNPNEQITGDYGVEGSLLYLKSSQNDGGQSFFIKRVAVDADSGAAITCWERSADALFDCVRSDAVEYEFDNEQSAIAKRNTLNDIGSDNNAPIDESYLLRNTNFFVTYHNGSAWLLKTLHFGDTNDFTLSDNGRVQNGTFQFIDSIVFLNIPSEKLDLYIKLMAIDNNAKGIQSCWETTLSSSFDCSGTTIEYIFTTLEDAQLFLESH